MKNPHQGKYKDEDVTQCPFMSKKKSSQSPFAEKIKMQSTEKKDKTANPSQNS